MKKTILSILLLGLAFFSVFGETGRLKLATTTSTDNSGLLDVLIPPFEKSTGLKVDVIAVGTGKALSLGANGDVDVVLVHARTAEDRFVNDGYGVNRRDVMHNDFIFLGPEEDPAGIKGAGSAAEALKRISRNQAEFISRGDDSGTHKKEQELWNFAGIIPKGRWYKEVGQGMGAVLTMADDLQAYTLADRGTYLSMKDKLNLVILTEGDPVLFNPYGVIAVNPDIHTHINYKGAMAFIDWLTSIQGQRMIKNYRKRGEILFYPDVFK